MREKETRQGPGRVYMRPRKHWGAFEAFLIRRIICSYLHFLEIHSFASLIIKLVIFLIGNSESTEMHLCTYIHPKVCNVYNKQILVPVYFKNIFIRWRECFPISLNILKNFWGNKNLNIELPYDTVIPLLAIYPREMKMCLYNNLYVNVHSIIQNSKNAWTTQMSINRCMG